MLDAAGAPQLPRTRARSLLGLLNSPETADWHNTAFTEYCMNDDSGGADALAQSRWGRMFTLARAASRIA